jgi:hypothetical protein
MAVMYVMSGDPTDFDGYLIARILRCITTANATLVIVVPERLATRNKFSTDPMEHDQEWSNEVVESVGKILRHLAGDSVLLVKGARNTKNLFCGKNQFDEPLGFYKPLVDNGIIDQQQPTNWTPLDAFADMILSDAVQSVIIDGNGSVGYMVDLIACLNRQGHGRTVLGQKMKASHVSMPLMAGVQADVPCTTMPMPNRDPRETMNSLYHAGGMRELLAICADFGVPVLFVTNNTCNALVKFKEFDKVMEFLSLRGEEEPALMTIATAWYSQPFFAGNYVLFDWLSFCVTLDMVQGTTPSSTVIEERHLYWVPSKAILVISKMPPGEDAVSEIETKNREDTVYYGGVKALVSVDIEGLRSKARDHLVDKKPINFWEDMTKGIRGLSMQSMDP